MNTKIYKAVHDYAEQLVTAAEKNKEEDFTRIYKELATLCYDNESSSNKNHPVQWETLADFTEDSDEALALYQKALGYAEAINAHDFLASINYAMAILFDELEQKEPALKHALKANENTPNIGDDDLKNEINELLQKLQA